MPTQDEMRVKLQMDAYTVRTRPQARAQRARAAAPTQLTSARGGWDGTGEEGGTGLIKRDRC